MDALKDAANVPASIDADSLRCVALVDLSMALLKWGRGYEAHAVSRRAVSLSERTGCPGLIGHAHVGLEGFLFWAVVAAAVAAVAAMPPGPLARADRPSDRDRGGNPQAESDGFRLPTADGAA
jgi:hypothetical protein